MNQLLISLLLLAGFVLNFSFNISPVLSYEKHSDNIKKDTSNHINNHTQITKDTDDKKDDDEEKDDEKEDNHEGHPQH